MLYISDTSRYTNIAYIGMYLVYLVLAFKERLISTNCFFFRYFPAFSYFIFKSFCYCHLRKVEFHTIDYQGYLDIYTVIYRNMILNCYLLVKLWLEFLNYSAYFGHVHKLEHYLYLRPFSIAIYGKITFNY